MVRPSVVRHISAELERWNPFALTSFNNQWGNITCGAELGTVGGSSGNRSQPFIIVHQYQIALDVTL
jgi:hypothetical protein